MLSFLGNGQHSFKNIKQKSESKTEISTSEYGIAGANMTENFIDHFVNRN